MLNLICKSFWSFLCCAISGAIVCIRHSPMLNSLTQRAPIFRPTFLSRLVLSPNYSKKMSSALPQMVANTHQPEVSFRTLSIPVNEDNPDVRQRYRPFILNDDATHDWINELDLTTAFDMADQNLRTTNERLKVLVLYGSLRKRSYSRLVALEASRILFRLGCDVRVFDPQGLPVKNDVDMDHPKVQELRELSKWSDGHIWVSPEQHGNLVSCIFITRFSKNSYLLIPFFFAISDCRLQESDRLDSSQYRKRPADPGPNTSYCSGMRWISVIQCRQLSAYPWSLDAYVYYPESIFHPEGIHTVPR
jgi:hypothetical protein